MTWTISLRAFVSTNDFSFVDENAKRSEREIDLGWVAIGHRDISFEEQSASSLFHRSRVIKEDVGQCAQVFRHQERLHDTFLEFTEHIVRPDAFSKSESG